MIFFKKKPRTPTTNNTAHNFPGAAKLYSEAIAKNPNDPTLWCNRAYARMKLEEYGYALADASELLRHCTTTSC